MSTSLCNESNKNIALARLCAESDYDDSDEDSYVYCEEENHHRLDVSDLKRLRSEDDSSTISNNINKKGNTRLKDPPLTFFATAANTAHTDIPLPPALCSECGKENHAPIQDCSMAARWMQRLETTPVATQVLPTNFVHLGVERYIRTFAGTNGLTDVQALERLLRTNWDETHAALDMDEPLVDNTGVTPSKFCSICFEPMNLDNMNGLSCQHKFCQDCWNCYLSINLRGPGALRLTCPQPHCPVLVPREFIADTYPAGVQEFNNQLVLSFVRAKDMMRLCPGADCDKVCVRKQFGYLDPGLPSLYMAYCGSCQTKYCAICGSDPHGTDPCPPVDNGLVQEAHERQTRLRGKPNHEDRLKACPSCSVLIQKIGGCNRMVCRCRHTFCWVCLEAMPDYSHVCKKETRRRQADQLLVDLDFIANAVKVNGDVGYGNLKQSIESMERFAHYHNLYFVHDQGQRFANDQKDCLHGRISNFTEISGFSSGADADFIATANETLVAARRMIKYTFAFAYETGHNARRRDEGDGETSGTSTEIVLFQSHQERLARFTEELSCLSENPLTRDDRLRLMDIISVVKRCVKATTDFSS